MSKRLIEQANLHYRAGTSDKVYNVQLMEVEELAGSPSRFTVDFSYGRRNGTMKEGTKTPVPTSKPNAQFIFNELVHEKLKKGYRQVPGLVRIVEEAPLKATCEILEF